MNLIAKMTPQTFSMCCRYMLYPAYNKENEEKLLRQVERFGLTRFIIRTIGKWSEDNEILHIINTLLTVAARDGTYHTKQLAKVMGNAMFLHKNVIPVVEAFVLALDDSPLRRALDTEFRSSSQRKCK